MLTGVLQDDILAPYPAIIVIDYIMRKAQSEEKLSIKIFLFKIQSRRLPPITLTDMGFTQDIALINT